MDKETRMVLLDAKNTASQFPMPVFGADVPPEMQTALMSMARQQVYGNAMVLAGECSCRAERAVLRSLCLSRCIYLCPVGS